jgi:hypothetical protein
MSVWCHVAAFGKHPERGASVGNALVRHGLWIPRLDTVRMPLVEAKYDRPGAAAGGLASR